MGSSPREIDVVGAGPAGLFAAINLAKAEFIALGGGVLA